jgi:radical SAM superfamily enzyme YgiQ (UPF0313 family)
MKKIVIIVLFQNLGERRTWYAKSPAPPLPGLLIAGLTPPIVEVEVLHEMIRPVDYRTDADAVALSFMDYCAPHAFDVARRFRALGKTVIAGGKYATSNPDEVQPHVDCVVIGEAERVWPQVVRDYVGGRLKERYRAPSSPPLVDIPPPRYDLAEARFPVPVVTEATRGCKYSCSFCQLTATENVYRMRPVPDVIRDLRATDRLPWRKRRLAMLYDNNLGGDIEYAKELLREMAKLNLLAWGAQFSFDCLHDTEFVGLLRRSHCRMAFIGMESLNDKSLAHVHKTHNRVEEYRELFERLRRAGVLTFAGLIFGLDADTVEYFRRLPGQLDEVGPEVVLMSIAIPIPGTPWHRQLLQEGRIVDDNLAHYEGDHLLFRPQLIQAGQLLDAFRSSNASFYNWRNIVRRWVRYVRSQPGFGCLPGSVVRSLITTAIYFQLSVFQRHHAERRVLDQTALRQARGDLSTSKVAGGPP